MKVIKNKRPLIADYPKVMIWEQYGMVAIFFSRNTGYVIDSGRTDTRPGTLVDNGNFTDFDGEIVIRNT